MCFVDTRIHNISTKHIWALPIMDVQQYGTLNGAKYMISTTYSHSWAKTEELAHWESLSVNFVTLSLTVCTRNSTNKVLPMYQSQEFLWMENSRLAYICYTRISNLWPVCKLLNLIISWLAELKTSPVQCTESHKAGNKWARPAHVLDGLAP